MDKKICGCVDDYLDSVLEEQYDLKFDEEIDTAEFWEKPDHQKIEEILDECKELLRIKGQDYNHGRIKMGDYYPRGVHSAIDIMNSKMLRIYSLLETEREANFESIEDSAKDLINYAAIFIGIARGLIETPDRNE